MNDRWKQQARSLTQIKAFIREYERFNGTSCLDSSFRRCPRRRCRCCSSAPRTDNGLTPFSPLMYTCAQSHSGCCARLQSLHVKSSVFALRSPEFRMLRVFRQSDVDPDETGHQA